MQVIAKIEKWAQLPDVQTQNGMTSKAQVVLRMSGGRNAEGLVGTAFGIVYETTVRNCRIEALG